MERKMGFWFKPLIACLLFAVLALAGCEGDDGAPGPAGPPGADGTTGAEVTVQDLANLGLVFSGDVVAINPTLDLSQTVAYNAATGALTVHFFLTDEDGVGIDVTKLPYEMRLYVSELLPADPTVMDNPGAAWTRLVAETFTPAMSPPPGTLTLVNAATGEYNYTAGTSVAASTNVTRVTMRARFRFRDLNNAYVVVANPVNASYDFLQSAPATALASSGADMVTTAACESCHGTRIGNVGHGGGYTQVKTCNHCHNLNYLAAQGDPLEADLAFMIHRIHAAGTFVDLVDRNGVPVEFTELTYPQAINTCITCHDGPEASLANSNPTRSNCGSCHSDVNFTKSGSAVPTPVDFATGTNHLGGVATTDAGCAGCHPAASITTAHNPAPPLIDTPEFQVTIAMTPPANGTHYVAGEAPVVTVTLADGAGTPVPGTVYTADQDGEGTGLDGVTYADQTEGLSTASLYIFGPRSRAVPVLATDTITDTVGFVAPPTQGHRLFLNLLGAEDNTDAIGDNDGVCEFGEVCLTVPNPDTLVTTTAAGFSYQLLPIPVGMEPGTYMVRFEGANFGATNAEYVTSSSALINFQVETATVEAKLSGDACLDCHGDTRMHLQGAHPHNAAFDTDECLGCHDFSGNYGDYIGNRVHAVHRGSVTGDTHGIDWSEVTFPQPANNCTICHTNDAVDTPVWRTPDMLACGGCHGTDPAVLPADFPTADPDRVLTEAAAAQHMVQNGGSTDPTVTPTLSCLVCHGEGRIADLFETHNLIQFRELPVDPNE
jgi:hypothetical protein